MIEKKNTAAGNVLQGFVSVEKSYISCYVSLCVNTCVWNRIYQLKFLTSQLFSIEGG